MWLLALILLIGGIVANYYYRDVAWAIRAAIGIVLLCLIAIVALQTTQGKAIWQFAKDARLELRKVVWPTRQETIQTTMIVIAMVVVVSLLLWGIDSILMWGVSWLTGQRG
ncbi:MAG: preprotein translocase subunit SecE [Coxiellaceae bacterium]|nr:MAG: preprotein translocase subunit SecE [Coxiellaceae bacterium]